MTTKQTTLRAKNMMYEQQLKHLPFPFTTKEELAAFIEKVLKPKRYALILHDKDVDDKGNPVEPHIHVMLSYDNARSINSIAKLLGDKPQSIEAWHGKAENGYSYLIHATDNSRLKHQYDANEVAANFDYPAMLQSVSQKVADANKYGDSAKIKNLLNLLYAGEITKDDFENRQNGALYGKAYREIKAVFAKRLELIAEEWRKQMIKEGRSVKVIWICGTAGTGKTSLAKEYAKKCGTDFLRITYPFGIDAPVMAPARFTDKALACDLIIITSPYDPFAFYNLIPRLNKKVDNFMQLHRRISLTVIMTQKEIFAAEYDSPTRRYVIDRKSGRPNPYSSASRPTQPADAKEIFNEMFD